MTNENEGLVDEAMERDPRTAPIGIYTGGSFVLDSCRVFCWFESNTALADYLAAYMPVVYEFDEDETAAYQEVVSPLLAQIREQGLSDELRTAFNQAVKDNFVIDWWGKFDELVKNETEFAQNISCGFLDDDGDERPIQADELEEFVDYLKSCGV